jgi:hypothetical protein
MVPGFDPEPFFGGCFNIWACGILDLMKQIISKENECHIIGHPDYSLPECRECRDSANPKYKDCLAKIVARLYLHK